MERGTIQTTSRTVNEPEVHREYNAIDVRALAALLLCCLIASCGTASFDVSLPGATPTGTVTPTPTGSPTPTPTPPIETFGNGQDGVGDISGQQDVNVCHPLTSGAAGGTSLSLAASAGFSAGDALLLIQMGDDTIADRAGRHELVRLASVLASDATTTTPLVNDYESFGLVTQAQACRVPEYTTVTVDGGIRPLAYNPAVGTGGVAALFASVNLTLLGASTVSSDGRGFPGGVCTFNMITLNSIAANEVLGGGKGRGIGGPIGNGRARAANGGGGGNPYQSGGGGGANAGLGGRGGWPAGDTMTVSYGEGGVVVPLTGARLVFGGGGGGGHSSDAAPGPACSGGAGGGVVFVQAATATAGGTAGITALGSDKANAPQDFESGGGGGAGGSVWVVIGDGTGFTPRIDVSGGDGGDVTDSGGLPPGPGGSGGGGRYHIEGFTPALTNVNMGSVGTDPGADARGAQAGGFGSPF